MNITVLLLFYFLLKKKLKKNLNIRFTSRNGYKYFTNNRRCKYFIKNLIKFKSNQNKNNFIK